jgi:hypothetical protein
MKNFYSRGVKDVLTAIGIIAGYYALMAAIVILAW